MVKKLPPRGEPVKNFFWGPIIFFAALRGGRRPGYRLSNWTTIPIITNAPINFSQRRSVDRQMLRHSSNSNTPRISATPAPDTDRNRCATIRCAS